MTDTGESTAAIERSSADSGWVSVLPRMKAGGLLKRNASTKRYYVDGHGSFTDRTIARLEREGKIRRVGAETYALVENSDG